MNEVRVHGGMMGTENQSKDEQDNKVWITRVKGKARNPR